MTHHIFYNVTLIRNGKTAFLWIKRNGIVSAMTSDCAVALKLLMQEEAEQYDVFEAYIDPRNELSLRSLVRAGFKKCSKTHGNLVSYERVCDSYAQSASGPSHL